MRAKKIGYLFLALLLPVLIFIFLKLFGRNEFEVKPLYQEGDELPLSDCGLDYTVPYYVPDSVMKRLAGQAPAKLYLVSLGKRQRSLNRITDEFGSDVKSVSPEDIASSEKEVSYILNCILLIRQPHTVVLVDENRSIRGYYTLDSREDADRLSVEINIMLKRF